MRQLIHPSAYAWAMNEFGAEMNMKRGKELRRHTMFSSRSVLFGVLMVIRISSTLPLGAEATEVATSQDAGIAIYWGAGYFGDLVTHPGIYALLKYPFLSRGAHQGFVQIKSFSYYHFQNHVALSLGVEVGYKATGKRGYFFDVSMGVGYLHTFLAGYTINTANTGRPSCMPSMGITVLGWDLAKTKLALPLQIHFLRLSAFGQYPFNRLILPHLAVEIGLTGTLTTFGKSLQRE